MVLSDQELIQLSLEGNSKALGQLIERYRNFIYNIVWKMVLSPEDAEDITQDIIIKILTNLAKFRGASKFSTWVYRITYNHIINLPKQSAEHIITTFDNYAKSLDSCADDPLVGQNQVLTPEEEMIIKESMLGCTSGMLLCLNREQRFIVIVGDLFGVESKIGAEITGITPDNFRQKLVRARRQLFNFMDQKCGLVNKSNPCRCNKKTKSFIKKGWVDPNNLKFNNHFKKEIRAIADHKSAVIWSTMEEKYAEIYQSHPFQEKEVIKERLEQILKSKDFLEAFELD